ncbi:MAG: acylneuraminate cytidylyltransferase family protein [Elusimicrobia bacterium]|nr:acylneuraminate cytidylyltransferase family protein [Candidatus Obscuribacterium magneticum]
MKKNEILAVIHARGGSKRIPLKNLAILNGKPLIAYPIQLAKSSSFITRIVVSTDHDKIMEEARQFGAEIPFRRPADISEDVPSELVTLHAMEFLDKKEGYRPEFVVTLTPTTPFTRVDDLDQGIRMLMDHIEWDSVVTLRKATEHPEWMIWKDETTGLYQTVLKNPMNGKYNVSQNLTPTYYPCGAFFINRRESLQRQKCLYGNKFGAVLLKSHNLDIDTPDDLKKAQEWVAKIS